MFGLLLAEDIGSRQDPRALHGPQAILSPESGALSNTVGALSGRNGSLRKAGVETWA